MVFFTSGSVAISYAPIPVKRSCGISSSARLAQALGTAVVKVPIAFPTPSRATEMDSSDTPSLKIFFKSITLSLPE